MFKIQIHNHLFANRKYGISFQQDADEYSKEESTELVKHFTTLGCTPRLYERVYIKQLVEDDVLRWIYSNESKVKEIYEKDGKIAVIKYIKKELKYGNENASLIVAKHAIDQAITALSWVIHDSSLPNT